MQQSKSLVMLKDWLKYPECPRKFGIHIVKYWCWSWLYWFNQETKASSANYRSSWSSLNHKCQVARNHGWATQAQKLFTGISRKLLQEASLREQWSATDDS